ncbi:MAG TPA: type I-U CRISPR-associated protein Csb2 [Streptosporangiaceae bacterium]
MFAIAVELLTGRYTAMQFNDRDRPEWPPHPARLFSAMVAAWADADEPDPAERSALRWLEEQDPPLIRCGEAYSRSAVTHFVPVNDPTTLSRDVSRSYAQLADGRQAVCEAERSGDERAVRRARATLARVEAKARTDGARAGTPTGRETGSVAARAVEVLPEFRGKQGRTYPTVQPDETTVSFLWPDASPSTDQLRILDGLLGRVARIGHSSTLVACRCANDVLSPTWVPGRGRRGTRLRVPRAGLIDRLERAYASHHGEEPRTLPAGMSDYHRPGAPQRRLRVPFLGGDWYVLGISGQQRPPSAMQALAVARAARNSLLVYCDQPAPEILSGHQQSPGTDGPTPPLERPHLAVAPLLNAGSSYGDGAVFGIALILPASCPADDRDVVERAIRSWWAAGFELLLPARAYGRSVRLKLEDLGIDRADGERAWPSPAISARRKTTMRDYWCRPSRRWLSVTPIALDRFPGKFRSREPDTRERAEQEAAACVARACVFAGLADRPEDVRVTVRMDAPLIGIPVSPRGRRRAGTRQFPGYQTGTGTPRVCVHAEIEFAEPVEGPVLVGAGRYLGYGLCLPRGSGKETP